jgi:hypothetical protein
VAADYHPALRVFQFNAKINLMEYRGIRYTIRAGIERRQYRLVMHPDGIEMPMNKIFGTREDAEVYARRLINNWLGTKSVNERQQ